MAFLKNGRQNILASLCNIGFADDTPLTCLLLGVYDAKLNKLKNHSTTNEKKETAIYLLFPIAFLS